MSEQQNPLTQSQSTNTQTNFLSGTETAEKDALYSDLFHKNDEGEIVGKVKSERSKLEIFTNIMGIVAPIVVVLALGGALFAFIRGQTDNSLTENFQFLCPVVNYGVNAKPEEKQCQTPNFIESNFNKKTEDLEKNIVNLLVEYIPTKISSSGLSSKEKNFIEKIYNEKVDYIKLIQDFDTTIKRSKSPLIENIFCKNFNIANQNSLTVQCDIYGGDIGAIDDRKNLGSSRLEATRFIEELSNTNRSKFLLENPPTVLSIEDTTKAKDIPSIFKTKTSVTLTMKYIPVSSEN